MKLRRGINNNYFFCLSCGKEKMNKRSQIQVHKLANKPTKLWEQLKSKQKQRKMSIKEYTTDLKEKQPDFVRFVMISDTHNKTDKLELPDGDVLLHGGDFTQRGLPSEIDHFNNFLGEIKHKYQHIVVIAGNHELTFDPNIANATFLLPPKHRCLDSDEMKKKLTNCRYIEDETVEIMGFKIFGSPWQPEYGGWAYNIPRGEKCLEKWNLIPDDTDILITHGPPLGYGDFCFSQLRAGCGELLSTIQQRVKPRIHLFGHIHEAYGIWTDEITTFVNASTCTLRYAAKNPPIVMDLKASNS